MKTQASPQFRGLPEIRDWLQYMLRHDGPFFDTDGVLRGVINVRTLQPFTNEWGKTQTQPKLPESPSSLQFPVRPPSTATGVNGRLMTPGGGLGEALRNLQRYVDRESFDNPQGGGQFGPELQVDTKGVEFGPWVRRFIAQVRRNWIPMIPYSAMSLRGHVVITFNVHRNGLLTDVTVVGPSQIDSFNSAAYGSLKATNPTQPLPPEYPSDQAFFTLTFYYNETPPR